MDLKHLLATSNPTPTHLNIDLSLTRPLTDYRTAELPHNSHVTSGTVHFELQTLNV